jgi:uncharacterized coiled-coil DUF342 family protein
VRECVTHHYACDCREDALASEIARLRRERDGAWEEARSWELKARSLRRERDDAEALAVRDLLETQAEVERLRRERDEASAELALAKAWGAQLAEWHALDEEEAGSE